MNWELNGPTGKSSPSPRAGEDERRRSRSESSPATPPQGEGATSNDECPAPEDASQSTPVDDQLPQPLTPGAVVQDDQASTGNDSAASKVPEPDELWVDPAPPNLVARKRGVMKKNKGLPQRPRMPLSPQQKLWILDSWQRSGLPARDFGALVDISRHTLYAWKRAFEREGPAGLTEKRRGGPRGSRLPELTKRTILMMKQAHPEWGCQRISDMLARGPSLAASPNAVARVLREAGYEAIEEPTKPHPDKVRSFERARPNELWQTDLFTFMLKRQNRRLHLVAFMDDHSRFITGYGLHASQSAALVIEVLRAALAAYGAPAEILTDNGAQYVTWRGKSQFTRELEKRGIKQIVARPRRPQTLGKIERFWGTLWRECIESAVFLDLADARQRIGLFIDWFNLQRVHQGIDGLAPADRFFEAAPQVLKTMKERCAANALELARNGIPKKPFYLTGQLDGKPFSVHREGDRVVLRQAGNEREEIDLVPPEDDVESAHSPQQPALPETVCPDGSPTTAWNPPDAEFPPGVSPIDELTRPLPLATPTDSPPISAEADSSDQDQAPSGEDAVDEGGAS